MKSGGLPERQWKVGAYRNDDTSANKKITKRAKRESSKAAVYVEDPHETDSLLSEGFENPYDERPVGAPPTNPTGERLLGRTFRLVCFLEEAEGSEELATVTEVGTFDYNDGDSENVLWFHYTGVSKPIYLILCKATFYFSFLSFTTQTPQQGRKTTTTRWSMRSWIGSCGTTTRTSGVISILMLALAPYLFT
jgi:hypothetical protein